MEKNGVEIDGTMVPKSEIHREIGSDYYLGGGFLDAIDGVDDGEFGLRVIRLGPSDLQGSKGCASVPSDSRDLDFIEHKIAVACPAWAAPRKAFVRHDFQSNRTDAGQISIE